MAFSAIYPHGRAYGTAGAAANAVEQAASSMDAGDWVRIYPSGLVYDALFKCPVTGNPILGYIDKAAYDPVRRQVRFISKAHQGDQRYIQYDCDSNAWSLLPDAPWDDGDPPTSADGSVGGATSFLGHGYQHNTIDPATGDLYFRRYNTGIVWHEAAATGVWTQLPSFSSHTLSGVLEWVPGIGTQGGLMMADEDYVHRWDKAANTWTTLSRVASQGRDCKGAYSAPNELFVWGGGHNGSGGGQLMWSHTATSTTPTQRASAPYQLYTHVDVTTVCPVSGDLLVMWAPDRFYSFAPASGTTGAYPGTWTLLTSPYLAGGPLDSVVQPTAGEMKRTVACPISTYGVVMYLFAISEQMWLYKHAG